MLGQEAEEEIEKLKIKKVELENRIALVQEFEEKEQLESEIKNLEKQIDILEKLKKVS